MVQLRRLLPVLLLVSLPPGSLAQAPSDIPEDELIVRLRPFPEAPRPAAVVDAVNQGQAVPGGLGVGGPHLADFLLPARLQDPMRDFYDENPFFPRARLERNLSRTRSSAATSGRTSPTTTGRTAATSGKPAAMTCCTPSTVPIRRGSSRPRRTTGRVWPGPAGTAPW